MKQLLSLFALLISFGTIQAQADSVRMFLFGHSLLDHRPPINPTPSDETTVAHWLHLLSQDQGEFYGATGQYGFLPQHANLPPIAQWGYDIVPPVWDSDLEPFADADFTTVLITAANFAQWQGADQPIPGQGGMTTVSATETIMDWVTAQEPSATIYIYENWPDMASFISGPGFPPTSSEFLAYNNYTTGGFHD
ncbi:MAG: T9SS C-terminal target domain-containing protein, partial [Bacteroidota bacterium]